MSATTQQQQVQSREIIVHGLSVRLDCVNPQIATWFEFDFRAFLTSKTAEKHDFHFTVHVTAPPESAVPALDEVMHTPYFVCFEQGPTRYVDYQGRALVIYDYENESGRIYSTDPAIAYEKLYLTLLSRIGEKLDHRGLHRVHSLGIVYEDFASLFLIPQGGGKTTLALALLGDAKVKLLSEDTPFINLRGEVFPFPFRLGVTNGENTDSIPEHFKRIGERRSGGYKVLIDPAYFRQSIALDPVRNKHLFCGRWTTAQSPRIVPMGKVAALKYLIRDCVFGLGLPQVIEFFLQSGLKACMQKASIAVSRMVVSMAAVSTADCYQLYLCKDRRKNADMILSFLEAQSRPYRTSRGLEPSAASEEKLPESKIAAGVAEKC